MESKEEFSKQEQVLRHVIQELESNGIKDHVVYASFLDSQNQVVGALGVNGQPHIEDMLNQLNNAYNAANQDVQLTLTEYMTVICISLGIKPLDMLAATKRLDTLNEKLAKEQHHQDEN